MAQTFKDRLKILIQNEKPYAWARKVGIEKGLFQYYWQKERIPTYENLIKIQKYSGCSLDWLLTGKTISEEFIFNIPMVREKRPVGDKLNSRRVKALESVNSIYSAKELPDIQLLELFLAKLDGSSGKKRPRKSGNK